MEIPLTNLLQSELILEEFGFKRLFRWKIDKKNYMIQLCPNMKHIHIMTTNMVRSLNKCEPLCQECVGRSPRGLEERLKDIYQHEHLIFKLFQILDREQFKTTCLWKEINSNLLGQTLFSHYLQAKEKHFYNPTNSDQELNQDQDISSDNLSESFDLFDPNIKKKLPHSYLIEANHNYFGIIIKLDQENIKLRESIKLLDEIIEEQNEIIDHFKQFIHCNLDIYDSFKNYHREIYPNDIHPDNTYDQNINNKHKNNEQDIIKHINNEYKNNEQDIIKHINNEYKNNEQDIIKHINNEYKNNEQDIIKHINNEQSKTNNNNTYNILNISNIPTVQNNTIRLRLVNNGKIINNF